ncbi:LppM family (lipo)protein [Thermoactinomyces mirandus]|uniref:DUF3153 domain-containing protein n=1 Tax=Thermoactinomyces mirandus TaxID=2756294 RepID=A0A7W1XUR1_9BACL|nr:LPXTG cell wall anchor domain-containing protein [Thermoactinomyces mirandus]MBA4603422.1 DUF3153 domain-containing protein [Thermoactinomyces mirandus]
MKRKLLLTLVLCIVFVLSGCMKADFNVKVNEDGSVDLNHVIAVQNEMLSLMEGENPIQKQEFETMGYKAEDYRENGYTGVRVSKHFKTADEMNAFLNKQKQQGETTFNITKEEGFFKDKYVFKGNLDMTDMTEGNAGEDEMGMQAFMSQLDFKFNLTLPMKVTKHDASRVNGNTYTWELVAGQPNNMQLEAEKTNIANIALVVGGAVIVLAGIGYLLIRRKKQVTV